MNSAKKTARVAGLLYLLLSIPGGLSLMYVPSAFIVSGDASATANKIRTSELLFRVCIVGELISAAGFIFVALALYRLLNRVDKTQASLMVMLWVISVPISFLNVLNHMAALRLVRGGSLSSVFDQRQMDALVMASLDLHGSGVVLAQIFWGLWLLPLGVLVYKSTFLPRILGVLLIVACFAYVASSLTYLLFPAYGDTVSEFAMWFGGLGELPFMLWLLIKGVKDQPFAEPA